MLKTADSAGGPLKITASIGAMGGTSSNLFGGFAQLLQAGQVKTTTLSVEELNLQGQHTIGLQFLRPATMDESSPFQYLMSFQAVQQNPTPFEIQSEVPEPGTILLLGLGLGFVVRRGWNHSGRVPTRASIKS